MPPITTLPATENVDELIASSHVVIFTMDPCKYCTKAKAFLDEHNVAYREVVIDPESNGMAIYEQLTAKVNRTSVPQVFVGGQHIGGCDDTLAKHEEGSLMPLIRGHSYEYDLVVIGGGSGGLAASKVQLTCAGKLFKSILNVSNLFSFFSGSRGSWQESSFARFCRSHSSGNYMG